ncbi:MAG TPA: hypothetical protein VIX84_03165 [Acidimicrobiales bacterium]
MAAYARQREAQAARTRAVLLERHRFVHAAACTIERVVKPALGDVAQRLNRHGGGGLLEERAADRRQGQRITLWMSLEGPVVVPARVDRNPYLQLDVAVLSRSVTVWEGDMWNKVGSSRRTEPFTLEELTTEAITQRAIAILRRTVTYGDVAREEVP